MKHLSKHKWTTVTTVGFALFAMFFGAGNLIFPPFIGIRVGYEWHWALIGLFITAILAPFLGVLMVSKVGKQFTDLGLLLHPTLVKLLTLLIILCIGPLVALPRTGATTFEIGIHPLLPDFSPIWFSILFFGTALILSISKTKIVDIIGRFLTPFLLFVLFLLIIFGMLYPTAAIEPTPMTATESFVLGFTEGYQTMDVLASVIFASIIIAAVVNKGFSSPAERTKMTLLSGMVSTLCLLFIYGGLIYLGATSGYPLNEGSTRTKLLLHISHSVLGHWGTMAVATAIGFACLTTAIALISAVSSFFEEFTKGRLPYKMGAVLCTLIAVVLSVNSVDSIIAYAGHILVFIYPIVFTIILYVLVFSNWVRTPAPYIASVLMTALLSLIDTCNNLKLPLGGLYELKKQLPLAAYDLEWVLPSLVVFLAVTVFKRR